MKKGAPQCYRGTRLPVTWPITQQKGLVGSGDFTGVIAVRRRTPLQEEGERYCISTYTRTTLSVSPGKGYFRVINGRIAYNLVTVAIWENMALRVFVWVGIAGLSCWLLASGEFEVEPAAFEHDEGDEVVEVP
ncbi:MAG: hypothetical protein LKI34_08520, partial [Bifidobacterium tibiigranuli]|uniref:hypothetical protein n=1 Tax=Bifidobacterium tibiigranuli TaxID=2172043 RepID=UPI0026EF11BC